MPRSTKIVATLGPSTDDADTLRAMIDAGLNVGRMNFSHGDAEDQAMRCRLLRRVADDAGRVSFYDDIYGHDATLERLLSANFGEAG